MNVRSIEYARCDRGVGSQIMPCHAGISVQANRLQPWLRVIGFPLLLILCAATTMWLHAELDRQQRSRGTAVEQLRVLPRGEVLKPVLLGYTQAGADLLWLRIVQVMGADVVRPDDYEWLFHALDVVTTLDPHFLVAYDLGGGILAELAGQVEWSNALLEKGRASNPEAWRLPFLLGFNHFFHLQNYEQAAHYMEQAAQLSGSPVYVPELAARLYVEARRPDGALSFLEVMLAQVSHPQIRESLLHRRKAVILERDLDRLEQAREAYIRTTGRPLDSLDELVRAGVLDTIPPEPFGGAYALEPGTGRIVSTTHPERMRLYRPVDAPSFIQASVQP